MNWAPTVDIVVPCYNFADIVGKCVNSLLKQSYSTNSIIIYLVNDGSSDETGDILESSRLQIPQIRMIVSSQINAKIISAQYSRKQRCCIA